MTVASAHRTPAKASEYASTATVQMPPGIPVASMAIGKVGAKNAAIYAAQILSVSDDDIAEKLADFKEEMVRQVEEKDRNLVY